MVEKYKLSGHNEAEIRDDVICLKLGMRNYEISLNDIVGIFSYRQTSDNHLLAIAFLSGGRRKKMQIPLSRLTPQPFFDELITRIPEGANLMHLDKKDALKKIGVMDGVIMGVIGLAVILPIIMIGLFFPQVWHFVFDSKLAHITIEEMYEGKRPESNYLTFTGKLKDEGMVRNVLWEKLRWSGWMDDLTEQEQSPVENPVVLELL